MPVSRQLDLLQRRVRYLDGKVGAVSHDFQQIQGEEQDLARRTGARPGASQMAISLLPAGYPIAVARSLVGDWPSFDRRWAGITGPKVRDMMSALVRLEELGGATRRIDVSATYPANERGEASRLWDLGNRLSRVAADLHYRWTANPISARDTRNRGWGSRWFELLVTRNSPLVALVGGVSGGTVSEMTESAAGRVTDATQAVGRSMSSGAAQTLDVTRTLASGSGLLPQGTSESGGEGYGVWWSRAVTGGALLAGGVLAYTIWKEIFAPHTPTRSEALEE